MSATIAERLTKLREHMKNHNLDFYFVPSRDEHNDEYLPSCWKRRPFITGFTGSAGDALIGLDSAYLWTDPRYFVQAEQQLDANYFTLMKQMQGMAAPIHEWLNDHASGKRVGCDPKLLSAHEQFLWSSALANAGGELVAIESNLIDEIWQDQPQPPCNPIIKLDTEFTGFSAHEKIVALRKELKAQQCNAHVVTMLDAIAWLYNIRGQDISYNPLAISYALVTENEAFLFIDSNKVDDKTKAHFKKEKITLKNYEDIANELQNIQGQCLVETTTASWWITEQIKNADIHASASPITMMKALKNSTEVNGMKEAHRRDGLALCKIFYWLENNWQGQTELSVYKKVSEIRAEDPHARGDSFSTIAGYASNGAIIHYEPNEETSKDIGDETLFLLDSGGQYYEGTTDVTRTTHFGQPKDIEKHHYTLVLKGHLALRHTQFPHGTCGEHINAIASRPLWSEGLIYGHGTGHGVGCYLCVHEGPQRISAAITRVPLLPGMIVSNEPGYYITGHYGIRIENLCAITLKHDGETPFYGFEDLTLFPYERKLLDMSILSSEEIEWINTYHQQIVDTLAKDLDENIAEWLKAKCAAL